MQPISEDTSHYIEEPAVSLWHLTSQQRHGTFFLLKNVTTEKPYLLREHRRVAAGVGFSTSREPECRRRGSRKWTRGCYGWEIIYGFQRVHHFCSHMRWLHCVTWILINFDEAPIWRWRKQIWELHLMCAEKQNRRRRIWTWFWFGKRDKLSVPIQQGELEVRISLHLLAISI